VRALSLLSNMVVNTLLVRTATSAETTPAVVTVDRLAARAVARTNPGRAPARVASRTKSTPSACTESDIPGRDNRLASIARALDSRPETVPIGHPS
jgi:hypothetical protein